MTSLALSTALPPRRAIEYLRSKGIRITSNWRELWQAAHARAFTVAGITRMSMLRDLREIIEEGLAQGMTGPQVRKLAVERLGTGGWMSQPWRLRNAYRTNLQTAFSVGRYQAQVASAQTFPFWQYVAVMDGNTRPSHAALNGKVARYDSPIWDTIYPPNGFGCRCRVRALTEQQVQARGLSVEPARQLRGLLTPDAGWRYNPGAAASQNLVTLLVDNAGKARIKPGAVKLNQLPDDVRNWLIMAMGGKRNAKKVTRFFTVEELIAAFGRMRQEIDEP